jgi:hypothetical protein
MVGAPWNFVLNNSGSNIFTNTRLDSEGQLLGRQVDLSPALGKGERGGLLPSPLGYEITQNGGFETKPVDPIDPALIRTALLFVDKIDVPDNSNISVGSVNIGDLAAMGLASRSKIIFEGGVDIVEISSYRWLAYLELNKREPGMWSIWQSPSEQIIPKDNLSENLAFQMILSHCFITPHPDLPYDDIITFKERYRDELLNLHHHLLKLAIKVSNELDPRAVTLELESFDLALADYLRKSRESNLRKAFVSLTAEMDWSAAIRSVIGGGGAGLWSASQGLSLSATTAAAVTGTLLAGLSIKSTAGLKKADPSPMRYLARLEREFGT